ncbi:MAG: TonB-dependent siderophore receptor [Desmonostoc vinosum HA7617-LM4]|jgi:iron complex outermembrane receptor protein|nr:TonB-dependent siderophore receptor [Desmonostoc vinosum HA7617-LM4]
MRYGRLNGISSVSVAFVLIAILTQPATSSELSEASNKLELVKNEAQVLAQQPVSQVVKVTGVQINSTDTGIELVLQTSQGEALKPVTKTEGNSLIADIPNAVLELPDGKEFRSQNPVKGIVSVTVTAIDASSIRVTVIGEASSPKVELFDDSEGLVFGFILITSSQAQTQPTPSQQLENETEPEQPIAQDAQAIELVVTGEQDGYLIPQASTATKTDTSLRDIPQSIQIVPRKLLDDRQITRVEQVADTVPGVQPFVSYGGTPTANFIIRGFNSGDNVYRDGFREFSFANPINIAGIEQIEFLKGPASVLYGQNEPGGLVNVVSKQPLQQPYYSPALTIGSFDFYQGTLDISGPLNERKTAAYRLNLAYENAGSFRDFVDSKAIFVAPALSFELGPQTKLTFNLEYQNYNFTFDRGFPAELEIFQVPTSRFLGEPDFNDATINYGRASYVLEHQFSENWKLRHGFAIAIANNEVFAILPESLQADRRTVDRGISRSDERQENYTLQTEVSGKFQTGSVAHQVLLGVELLRYRFNYQFFNSAIAPIDLFNPTYGAQPEGPFVDEFGPDTYGTDAISFYFQDQVTFSQQWKLLAGGRLDLAHTSDRSGFDQTLATDNTDLAFSPRVGLVYQPFDWLSLYASYASSFNPVIFGTSRTGESFEPEQGSQLEAGIKADVIPSRLSATFAVYEITKKNVLITDPEDDRFSLQTGEQKSQGIEFNLVGRPIDGWDIALSYAYTDAFVSEDTFIPVGDELAGSAKHQFGLWNSYELQTGTLKGLGFGLGLYYVSKREAVLPNTDVDLPSYFRADAAIFYKRDNWKVQLNVNNLTNADIYNTRGFLVMPQPPLTVLGTISYTF